MNIAFRLDASVQIGAGHMARCLTLADALRKKGATAHFLCRNLSIFDPEAVRGRGHAVHMLPEKKGRENRSEKGTPHGAWLACPQEDDADDCLRVMETIGPVDWVVADHYALDATWEEKVRRNAKNLFVIDDLADRRHACDLLLDQTYNRFSEEYAALTPPRCVVLAGSGYALLRPQFKNMREKALEKRRARKGGIENILVFLSSSDPMNATGFVLHALGLLMNRPFTVTAVLGSKSPHLHEISRLIRGMPYPAKLYTDVEDMASLMTQADIAVGAGGTASWERCCLGLPAVVIEMAENQSRVSSELEKAGAVTYLGRFNDIHKAGIADAVRQLDENPGKLAAMANRAAEICDGLGADKVAGEMLKPQKVL